MINNGKLNSIKGYNGKSTGIELKCILPVKQFLPQCHTNGGEKGFQIPPSNQWKSEKILKQNSILF